MKAEKKVFTIELLRMCHLLVVGSLIEYGIPLRNQAGLVSPSLQGTQDLHSQFPSNTGAPMTHNHRFDRSDSLPLLPNRTHLLQFATNFATQLAYKPKIFNLRLCKWL